MMSHLIQPVSHGKKSRLWSLRLRLDGWTKLRTFPLHVTDKRVASQKAEKLVQELEREEAGIIAPKLVRDAAQTPVIELLKSFLADLEKQGRALNTLSKYRNSIPLLCRRCNWVRISDITVQSFTNWRTQCGLRAKTLNDLLGTMGSFMHWLERQQQILANPLKHVERIKEHSPREYRRALRPEDARRLLETAPFHRAVIYLLILNTGLRSKEVAGLKWQDFDLDAQCPSVRVSTLLAKNHKSSVHYLRPEVVAAIRAYRPLHVSPSDFVFRGKVPRVPTFKRDLAVAGIPFHDERGQRVDVHALRKTFGTMLAVAGVPLRVGMELMRHSESKLTERVYTDSSHLPTKPAIDSLPSLSVPNLAAQLTAQTGDVSGHTAAQPDAS